MYYLVIAHQYVSVPCKVYEDILIQLMNGHEVISVRSDEFFYHFYFENSDSLNAILIGRRKA